MAYRDLDSDKFYFLLAKGTHEGELKRFFSESKAQLIMKQAKVQNLPYGRQERIRVICDRLPRSTDGILRDWFQRNITMADPLSVEEVVTDLTLYEQMNERIPDEHGGRLARSSLVHLFSEDPPSALLDFLARKSGSSDSESPSGPLESEVAAELPRGTLASPFETRELAELLAAVISGEEEDVDEALVPFPNSIQTMVDALLAARSGDINGADTLASSLNSDSHESRLLQLALNQARSQQTKPSLSQASTAPSGIRVNIPQPLEGVPDADDIEIIGVCSNEAEKAVFVRPLCLLSNGHPALLTQDDRTRLFPESGDVMTFRTGGKRLPHRGEIVRWKVAERDDAGGKTKFHYVSEPTRVIEVIKVPFSSTSPDDVREYIKDLVSTRRSPALQTQLFALSDGLTIAPPSDPGRDDAYEQPWQSWNSLETWLLEGRMFCFGMPIASPSQLDLSPLDAAFKRVIKNLIEAKKASFTKNQVRDLAGMIRGNHAGETASRASRIADSLERIVIDTDAVDSLLPLLASREEVRQRVEAIVEKEVSERLKEKAGLLAEADELRRKKEDLARESREIERRISAQKSQIESSVAKTFARAIEDGVTSLAQAEIFRSLAGSPDNRQPSDTPGNSLVTVQSRSGSVSRDEGINRLVAFGVKRRQAVGLALAAKIVGRAGGCLIIRGAEARQIVRVLAQVESETVAFLEIPMGLTSSTAICQVLATMSGNTTSFAVLDADLSPIEAYAGPLLDRQFDAVSNGQKNIPLMFSCVGGDLSLPLPSTVRRIAVVIDLDSCADQSDIHLSELEEESVPLARSLYKALAEELEQLQGAERTVVESLIVRSFEASL